VFSHKGAQGIVGISERYRRSLRPVAFALIRDHPAGAPYEHIARGVSGGLRRFMAPIKILSGAAWTGVGVSCGF